MSGRKSTAAATEAALLPVLLCTERACSVPTPVALTIPLPRLPLPPGPAAGDKRADVAQRAFNKPFNKIVVNECGILN